MSKLTAQADAFPKTPRTWICSQLGLGKEGLAQANRHVMAVYAEPLKIYFRGSSFRGIADADEIVNDFFADRLGKPDFLTKWERSERPMRYWLLVAFRYFMLEQLSKRQPPSPNGLSLDEERSRAASPSAEFHCEVAKSIVRQAARASEVNCRQDGLEQHWDIWIRHHLHGRPLVKIASDLGEDVVRVKVMARTAGNRFRRTLREMLTWPGASRERVDQEIRELIMMLGKEPQ